MNESLSSLQFEGRCIIIDNEENNKQFILSVLSFFKNLSIHRDTLLLYNIYNALLLISLLFAFKKECLFLWNLLNVCWPIFVDFEFIF